MIRGAFILKCFLLLNGKPLSNQDFILCDQTRNEALEIRKTDSRGYAEFLISDTINKHLDLLARVMNDTLAVLKYSTVSYKNDTTIRINIESSELREIYFSGFSSGNDSDSLRLLIAADSVKGIPLSMHPFFIAGEKSSFRMSAFTFYVHKNETLMIKMIPGDYRVCGRILDEKNQNNIYRTSPDYEVTSISSDKKELKGFKYTGFEFNIPGDSTLRLIVEPVH